MKLHHAWALALPLPIIAGCRGCVQSEARGHETLVLVPVNLIIYAPLGNELIFSACRTTKAYCSR